MYRKTMCRYLEPDAVILFVLSTRILMVPVGISTHQHSHEFRIHIVPLVGF